MMGHLSPEEQQLVLDFYFRCGSEHDINRGRDLIAAKSEAARLYANLEDTLTELDSIKYEPCPDNLADLTVARLKLAAAPKPAGVGKLEALLKEQQKSQEHLPASLIEPVSTKGRPWRPIVEILATAAAVVLAAGVLFPSFGAMRQRGRQVACAQNLAQIGQAMATFGNDHNGQIGQITVKAGAPWWKIGYQGPETQSNTRYVWQLVKDGYVDGRVFICDGHIEGRPVQYDAARMAQLNDFPSRRHISYSFVLLCDENNNLSKRSRRPVAADLNPLFQQIPLQPAVYQQINEFERVQLNEQLRRMMSPSHRGKGQNTLFSDGSVEFIQTRFVNNDDIFTIDDVDTYAGREAPHNPDDIFLVP